MRGIRRAAPRAEVSEVLLRAGHFGLVVGSTAATHTWPTVGNWVLWRDGRGPMPAGRACRWRPIPSVGIDGCCRAVVAYRSLGGCAGRTGHRREPGVGRRRGGGGAQRQGDRRGGRAYLASARPPRSAAAAHPGVAGRVDGRTGEQSAQRGMLPLRGSGPHQRGGGSSHRRGGARPHRRRYPSGSPHRCVDGYQPQRRSRDRGTVAARGGGGVATPGRSTSPPPSGCARWPTSSRIPHHLAAAAATGARVLILGHGRSRGPRPDGVGPGRRAGPPRPVR